MTKQTSWRLTPEQREMLVEDYRNGVHIDDIASKYGVHPNYAAVAARRKGVVRAKPDGRGRPIKSRLSDKENVVHKAVKRGKTFSDIAELYGWTRSSVAGAAWRAKRFEAEHG